MKYRIFAAVLCAALALTFASCKGDDKEITSGADETEVLTGDTADTTDTEATEAQTQDETSETAAADAEEKVISDVRFSDGEKIYNVFIDDSGRCLITRTDGEAERVEYVDAALFDGIVNDVLSYGFDRYGNYGVPQTGTYCSVTYSDGSVLTVTPDDLPEKGESIFNTLFAEFYAPFAESETAAGEITYPDAAG